MVSEGVSERAAGGSRSSTVACCVAWREEWSDGGSKLWPWRVWWDGGTYPAVSGGPFGDEGLRGGGRRRSGLGLRGLRHYVSHCRWLISGLFCCGSRSEAVVVLSLSRSGWKFGVARIFVLVSVKLNLCVGRLRPVTSGLAQRGALSAERGT